MAGHLTQATITDFNYRQNRPQFQKETNMKTTPSITQLTRFLIFSLTLIFALTLLATRASAANNSSVGLEGTWVVSVQVSDPPPGFPTPFTALGTYSRGGGLVTTN